MTPDSMTPDCRNDCAAPLRFPRTITNRPGLARIDYRIGTFADLREALLRGLDRDPVLQAWTYRGHDDPGIALLEGAAVLGDILTFYQEVYANEAYLRTARWHDSVADLVRLTGYRLAPGVGGRGTFAFEVKGEGPVHIPAGFPVKGQLDGREQQDTFETADEATAYPALSRFALHRPWVLPTIDTGTSVLSVSTQGLGDAGLDLQAGDRLFLADVPANRSTKRQVAVVKATRARFGRTEIVMEGSWQEGYAATTIHAYKLGRTFRYFGHNAPPEQVTVEDDGAGGTEVRTASVSFDAEMGGLPHTLLLDAPVDDLAPGALILVDLPLRDSVPADGVSYGGDMFFEARIQRVAQVTATRGAISGGSTRVEIELTCPACAPALEGHTDIRQITIREVIGERFAVRGAYADDAAATDLSTLHFFGDATTYERLDARPLLFAKEDGTYATVTVTTDAPATPGERLRPVYLAEPLSAFTLDDFPLLLDEEAPPVTVYGNLAEATQGASEREATLGDGDQRQAFQTFKLPKAPLTYLVTPGDTPPERPELEVYVDGRMWARVDTLFGQPPDAEVYIVREDAEGASWVQFGDGQTGRRLPSGVDNVVARYRTGTGAFGPLKEETTVQPGQRLDRLGPVQLPGLITGGDQPEAPDKAREAAPGRLQTLGRLVSLDDYRHEALALSGVATARAAWALVDQVPTMVVTVLMDTGRGGEIDQVEQILRDANRCRGARRFPIVVQPGRRWYVAVAADVAYDPALRESDVLEAVRAALGSTETEDGLFALQNRAFAQPEYATRIAATIQEVDGVGWTTITGLHTLGEADDPADLVVPAVLPLSAALACDDQHVLALDPAHVFLHPIALTPEEAC